jgi:capsular polysaccharide biosynthesis protein
LKTSELDHFVNLMQRRWIVVLAVCVIGIALAPVIAMLVPMPHQGTAELMIVSQTTKDTTLSDPDLPSILTSTSVLDRVIDRLKLNTNPVSLAKKIKTKSPAKSSIIALTYADRDGVRAAAVANAIADESSAYFHEVATRGYNEAVKALNVEIAHSKARIAAADRTLQTQRAYASSDKVLDDLTRHVDDLRVQREQIASALAADEATAAATEREVRNISPIARGEILAHDVIYQQLQSEVGKDVADLNSERASFRAGFPGLAALDRRVKRERNQLRSAETVIVKNGAGLSPSLTQAIIDGQKTAASIAADRGRLSLTDKQVAAAQKHLAQVAGAAAFMGTLRAQRDAALQEFIALNARLGAARGDAAQAASLGNLVVVSRAVVAPSDPGLLPLLMAAVLVALALAAAYAVDAIDRRLWGVREIENLYGRPVVVKVEAQP